VVASRGIIFTNFLENEMTEQEIWTNGFYKAVYIKGYLSREAAQFADEFLAEYRNLFPEPQPPKVKYNFKGQVLHPLLSSE
jgi:hypothetical protein